MYKRYNNALADSSHDSERALRFSIPQHLEISSKWSQKKAPKNYSSKLSKANIIFLRSLNAF